MRGFFPAIILFFCTCAVALAASCPYCGQVYGEPAPGDEARVYALRAEHEANCPARFRNTAPQTTQSDQASYGVVTIYNQTNRPVSYQIQLRAGGAWNQATVQPGRSYYHWQTLPAQFQIRFTTGRGGVRSYNLDYNTVTGRQPTWQDGRPFYISGAAENFTFGQGKRSAQVKPKISSTTCHCGGTGCHCLWDSCGKNGGAKCGCGGKEDCDCKGKRCPKFANTTQCTGSILCDDDGKWHCNRHGCAKGAGRMHSAGSHSPFAGSWMGAVRFGIAGTLNLRLEVNADGTVVKESGGLASGSHRTARAGNMLSWRSGVLNEVEWTLTLADANSAVLTVKSPLGVNDTATFRLK